MTTLHAIDGLISTKYTYKLSDDHLVLRVNYSAQVLWSAFPGLVLT
jgi:hypothetical protein